MDVKTLRDEIAIAVLQGIVSHKEFDYAPMQDKFFDYAVIDAYKMADAMMKERNKNG